MFADPISRRKFLIRSGAFAVAAPVFAQVLAQNKAKKLYSIGCSAITWGGNDAQAIQDIASLGLRGIQLRANSYKDYKDKPDELKALLGRHKLQLGMFSSGNVNLDVPDGQAQLETHLNHAKFVKALGGKAIQLTNSSRPKDRMPTPEELKKYAQLMNEVGKRTADVGVQAAYHNHMHQLGETPEEVDAIVQALDTRYVKLLLDVAHYWQGGGDPAKAVRQYKDMLYAMHLKDVARPHPEKTDDPKSYQFVELGQGKLDLPAVFAAMDEVKFKGWGIIELDSVPDKSRTALQCNRTSVDYLAQKIGLKV
jgi:inosose dehydratase